MRTPLAGLLLLAACEAEQPLPPERPNAQIAKVAQPSQTLPKQLEFAGRWAASVDQCATGWWDFGGDDVRTAGELGCSVVQDERTETSAKLQLTCVGEGMPTVETWMIEGTDQEITVARDNAAAVTLVPCPAF